MTYEISKEVRKIAIRLEKERSGALNQDSSGKESQTLKTKWREEPIYREGFKTYESRQH